MDESILNHLFLPHYLPSSADDDFLIQHNHQNEYKILEYMIEFLNSIKLTNVSPIFPVLTNCIERWSRLQAPQNFHVSNIQFDIKQLPSGSFFPLYFCAQNAAILIEIDENDINQALISAWQVLLPTDEIISSSTTHLSCFPVTTYRLCDKLQLSSKVHCELLVDFMFNTIEYSKSYKCSREFNEIREVPESHYVCQWWIQHFNGIKIEPNANKSSQFKKKHRDQIRWSHTLLPFRRSGLWMTIKVVFQTILVKRLGNDIGTIIYKLLITHFLTHVICTKRSTSIDLLIHCIRKIVRRLSKIDNLMSSVNVKNMNQWIIYTKQQIELKIHEIIPKSTWQNSIRIKEQNMRASFINNFDLNNPVIYQHSCLQLKTYLNNNNNSNQGFKSFSGIKNDDISININQEDYIPSYDVLVKQLNYTITTALTYIEIWIETRLEQWINRPSISVRGKNRFEILLRFFEEYQTHALSHYCSAEGPTDPMGYSRFILSSLTIIHWMHKKLYQDKRFERLKLHSLQIHNILKLFEFLVLPNRDDMIRARDLYFYFTEFNSKLYPDILNNIESKDAFGVYFAGCSPEMNDSIQHIRIQAEQDKKNKITEVNNAKQRYNKLMNIVNTSSCQYIDNRHKLKKCNRCKRLKEAKRIRIKVFECPLPSEHESALAVIFELQMPIEIRCYRDIIWQFINRPQPNPENRLHEWLTVTPHNTKLKPFYTGPNNSKVRLVSSTKSLTQSHYSTPPSIASTSATGFLFENSLKVQISPSKPIEFEDECRILTPQFDHPDYKSLQFTINTTQFAQNQVIAQLSKCSPRLKLSQVIEFGSFRSGHRLQWWNLLTILEMDSLSFADESVGILILHSILQYGPLISDIKTFSTKVLFPESHQQLLDDHFVDEFISRLDYHLDDCELNWQNELVLIVITIITVRILTICNSTRESQVANLLIKCRKIGEKWIDLISETIQTTRIPLASNEIEKLRLKMVNIGISCILTFSTYENRIDYLVSSNEHIVSLLKAVTTVHDNIILNNNHSNMSTFIRNMMRFSERILVMIQPTIAKYLHKTSYQSLNEFTAIYWAMFKIKGSMNGEWKKRREDLSDGWYDCQYESKYISIDCIRGIFLIDGMTISFLPEKITSNELFVRVFGSYVFEVQAADSPNTYVTKNTYEKVQYEFHLNNQTNRLIINERHITTNEIFQLIPHNCFENELPDILVSNHSHWWNQKNRTIEFRLVHFKDKDFLTNKPYLLSIETGYVTTNEQILIKQSSTFFQSLFNRYFIRLDDKPYVYMIQDNSSQIHIHLSRLEIAFQYNIRTNIITSREYSDMCIDEDQWLGTLTGLTSGLLLSPLPIDNQKLEHYPYRKLIVPFGKIFDIDHQMVTIDRSSSISFLHQYFVFILNDRLKILQSTDSPTGWLYLALLHAKTSHPLPDQYTGMTGMERAFQLLNSAGCWSDQSYDPLSLDILGQIGAISPQVNYYPEHLTCMVEINWNSNSLPYSMQHFGYYLIAKQLIETSEQLNFMHLSTIPVEIPKIFNGKQYNEILLKKLYWDYRDSYNPIARLSVEMEENILRTFNTKSYQPILKICSNAINYRPIDLTDMYQKGNISLKDCSNQHWLPLSQWLSDENQLKIIWIGLLKKIDHIKTMPDDIKRFEGLLDFLHYISDKCQIKPYYLQMLKTALKMPYTLSLRLIRESRGHVTTQKPRVWAT